MFKSIRLPIILIVWLAVACAPQLTSALPTRVISDNAPTRVAQAPSEAPTLASQATSAPTLHSPTTTANDSVRTPIAAATPTATVAVPNNFDVSRALEHDRMLSVTIGKRVAGTDGGTRAADYLAQQFASYGYAVERQAFPFNAWEDDGTTVKLTAPESRDLEAQTIQYSVAGHLEAQLVAVTGLGNPEDFSKVDVKGKIALVARGTIPFSDKAKNAANAGAAAVLIYNNGSGLFGGTLHERVSIPALAASGEEGKRLLDALGKGAVSLRIDSNTSFATKDGHNIIATRRGTSADVIVLGGHYDTVSAGPGANDNGSGTALLLELARALSFAPHKLTLVFIAFDGEEFGLLGSQYYVQHLEPGDRARIRAMLNFDMLGGGSGPLLLGGDGATALKARASAKELGITAQNFSLSGNAGSDHESFARENIDTVFFLRDYNLLHTPQDTIDQVKQEYLAESGKVALRLMQRLDAE